MNKGLIKDTLSYNFRNPPSHLYVSDTCKRGHGENGKTLKYKSNGTCIYCNRTHGQSNRNKRDAPVNHFKAEKLRDEIELQKLINNELNYD